MNPNCTPDDILSGRRVLLAYDQGFGSSPLPVNPAGIGLKVIDVAMSCGDYEPECCYGIVTESLTDFRRYLSFRGTANGAEWLEDGQFWPRPVAWAPRGAMIEHGFYTIIKNTRLASGRTLESLNLTGVDGHSLGAAVAEGMAAKLGVSYAGLWASPRLGNETFRQYLLSRVSRVFRPYMLGDVVPNVPFDLEPFFEYLHPPGFQIDNPAAANNPKCRHALLTYLNAFDSTIGVGAGCVAS